MTRDYIPSPVFYLPIVVGCYPVMTMKPLRPRRLGSLSRGLIDSPLRAAVWNPLGPGPSI